MRLYHPIFFTKCVGQWKILLPRHSVRWISDLWSHDSGGKKRTSFLVTVVLLTTGRKVKVPVGVEFHREKPFQEGTRGGGELLFFTRWAGDSFIIAHLQARSSTNSKDPFFFGNPWITIRPDRAIKSSFANFSEYRCQSSRGIKQFGTREGEKASPHRYSGARHAILWWSFTLCIAPSWKKFFARIDRKVRFFGGFIAPGA